MTSESLPSPQQPEGYLDGIQYSTLDNDELQKRLSARREQEEKLDQRREKAQERLVDLAVKESVRGAHSLDASELVSARRITDPYKPAHKKEIPRAPETLIGRITMGRVIGAVATRNSVHGPNGSEVRSSGSNAPAAKDLGFFARRKSIKAAERLRNQSLRQERSRQDEALSGGGVGLGVTAKVRTAIKRHNEGKALRQEFKNPITSEKYQELAKEIEDKKNALLDQFDQGLISDAEYVELRRADKVRLHTAKQKLDRGPLTAAQYLVEAKKISNSKVVVPTKSVRRSVRRERAGALFTIAAAKEPVKSTIDEVRKRKTERTITKANEEIALTRENRANLEAELQRRANEEANSTQS